MFSLDNTTLIALILVFAGACVLNFRYGIYVIIFLMPAYLLRLSIGGIPTTVLELMIYTLFLLWTFSKVECKLKSGYSQRIADLLLSVRGLRNATLQSVFKQFRAFDKKRENGAKNLIVGILLLFLGLTISTIHSSSIETSLGIFKGWFFDPFLFFILFVNIVKRKEHIAASFFVWLLSGFAVSLAGLFYVFSNELTFDGRLKAFFLSPNHLAMYIAPTFLISLAFLLQNILNKPKQSSCGKLRSCPFLGCAVLLIIFIALFFTYSRGAFLGVFSGALYLLFSSKNRNFRSYGKFVKTVVLENRKKLLRRGFFFQKRRSGHITACMFFTLLLFLFLLMFAGEFNQIIKSNDRSSFHSRLMIWTASAEIAKDHFLFGIGPGTFQDAYLSYSERFNEPYLEWAVPQPHNIFLAFYLQTGIVGLIGFVLILLWFFSVRSQPLAARAIMIYFLIHGIVDTTYWKNDLSLMFWLIIAVSFVSENFHVHRGCGTTETF